MDKVARLPAEQRRDLFSQTAGKMNLRPALIEKDFWVCWTLKRIFSIPHFRSHLLFKGGTTLSKIFGVTRRFSEDIRPRRRLGDARFLRRTKPLG